MTTKVLYVLIAILILAGVGFYLYDAQQNSGQDSETLGMPRMEQATNQSPGNTLAPSNTPAPVPANTAPVPAEEQGRFSDESTIDGPDIQVHQVSYDGQSFSPASLTIKQNDIVVFKNNSNEPFQPASAPHPTHTAYPEFDAQAGIDTGKSFQFKFAKAGNWKYHDHLNSSVTGTIVVEN